MSDRAPIPVLHLITELDVGGAQTALYRLLANRQDEQFQYHVACLYNGDGKTAEQIRGLGITVTDLGMRSPWHVGAMWHLYRLLRRERPFILYTWLFHANISGRIVGRLTRVPIIISGRRGLSIGGTGREQLTRWTASLDDRVVAVCEMARQAEIKHAGGRPEKVVTIYNGIKLAQVSSSARVTMRQKWGIAPEIMLLGFVGRLHPVKGVGDLLRAVAVLRPQHPFLRLLIVGDSPLRADLEQQAAAFSLSDTVIFAGRQDDVAAVLPGLDVLVLPSLAEGLSNILLEAMAAGLPVVATAVGGTPELVIDGETGLLVPPQDADSLALAIRQLLENPILARQMGEAGRRRVQTHFSMEQMVKQTEQLYDALLQAKGLMI